MATVQASQWTLNGVTYNMTKVTSGDMAGYWTAQPNAPTTTSFNETDGVYAGTITATNEFGIDSDPVTTTDENFGDDVKLQVKETTCPVISNISPASDAYMTNSRPNFSFDVSDESGGSGVDYEAQCGVCWNADTIANAFENQTCGFFDFSGDVDSAYFDDDSNAYVIPATHTNGTVSFAWGGDLPTLADGEHEFKFFMSDNDGNIAGGQTWQTEVDFTSTTQYASLPSTTFSVDTVVPELNVTAPTNNFNTNQSSVTVTGTATDTTDTVEVKITVGEAVYDEITLDESGNFSQSVILAIGENTMTITATDAAGGTTTITRTVSYSTTKPVVTDVQLTPNPVATGAAYLLYVKFDDDE